MRMTLSSATSKIVASFFVEAYVGAVCLHGIPGTIKSGQSLWFTSHSFVAAVTESSPLHSMGGKGTCANNILICATRYHSSMTWSK